MNIFDSVVRVIQAVRVQEQLEKRGKRLIISGFACFALTLLSFFITMKFVLAKDSTPSNSLLFVFAGLAIVAMLLAFSGLLFLLRSVKKR